MNLWTRILIDMKVSYARQHVAAKRYRTWWDTCRKIVSMPDSERKNFTGFMMVKGGRKIVANRWEDANGETGILVWNADDKPAKVSVAFGGRFVSASEPERGEVDVDDPIPPNSLRMHRYKVSDAKGLHQ